MFTSLVNRSALHHDWQKIPWHDPDFSRRMLAEHLNQDHDLASRRTKTIAQQVEWIHHKVLNQQPARILDLGCGPGFYTRRFAALGHRTKGIDFSPASITFAREQHPEGDYLQADLGKADFGTDYDLVSLIYGELNAFAPKDANAIIHKAYDALKPKGKLLLEVHHYEAIYQIGQEPATWHTTQKGLFADEPYLCLTEHRFELDYAISDYYVYVAESGAMQHYTSMHQAYTDDEYRRLLYAFEQVTFYPSLTGDVGDGNLFAIVAEK